MRTNRADNYDKRGILKKAIYKPTNQNVVIIDELKVIDQRDNLSDS